MNQDKLDGLYARATDERTPEEERRTAAVLYLKHAPRSREPTKEELRASITKDMFHSLFGLEIAEFQRKMTEQKKEQQYFNNFGNQVFSMDELFNTAKRVNGL